MHWDVVKITLKLNKPVFSLIPQLSTWHCLHFLQSAGACCGTIAAGCWRPPLTSGVIKSSNSFAGIKVEMSPLPGCRLCDLIRHASSSSRQASCKTLYSVYFTLFYFTVNEHTKNGLTACLRLVNSYRTHPRDQMSLQINTATYHHMYH